MACVIFTFFWLCLSPVDLIYLHFFDLNYVKWSQSVKPFIIGARPFVRGRVIAEIPKPKPKPKPYPVVVKMPEIILQTKWYLWGLQYGYSFLYYLYDDLLDIY